LMALPPQVSTATAESPADEAPADDDR
jgi:hypothetical protein